MSLLTKDGIFEQSFSLDSDKLPTIKDLSNHISFDDYDIFPQNPAETLVIRDAYIKNSFPLLNHDFFSVFKPFTKSINAKYIVELNCGIGWFTHWARKYDVPIKDCVDNKTWETFDKDNFLDAVTEDDSLEYVKKHDDVDLYILSWPPMNDLAVNIWREMKDGQYLLVIGESEGGCTANDDFFTEVYDHVQMDEWGLQANFRSFWAIHDYPTVYKK